MKLNFNKIDCTADNRKLDCAICVREEAVFVVKDSIFERD